MRYSKAFGSFVVVLCLTGVAHAAPPSDSKRAAQSFAAGKGAFARGDYPVAAAAFEQAATYAPHPAPLLNAAEAWELAGNNVRAAQMCDRVLDIEGVDQKYRQVALQQLSRVTARIATADVQVPEGARLNVEGERDDVVGHKVRMTPGAHTITATYKGGETRSESVNIAAGASKDLDLTSPAPERPKEPPPPPKVPPPEIKVTTSSGPRLGTWLAFGAAAASGGMATFFGLRTIDARSNFDASPSIQTRDDFNSTRLLTNVFIGVAAVSAIVGVVLWVTAPLDPSTDSPRTRTPKSKGAMTGVIRF